MFFVGRERETKKIIYALEDGRNVILKGLYGIGRTALAKHVAEVVGNNWVFHFIDFSRTPRKMCVALAEDLHMHTKRGKKKKPIRYKRQRFEVLHGNTKSAKRHVVVFDNVSQLTRAKISLLRSFSAEQRFQSIAIIEHFIEKEDAALLRALLYPANVIHVGYLNRTEAALLAQKLAEKKT